MKITKHLAQVRFWGQWQEFRYVNSSSQQLSYLPHNRVAIQLCHLGQEYLPPALLRGFNEIALCQANSKCSVLNYYCQAAMLGVGVLYYSGSYFFLYLLFEFQGETSYIRVYPERSTSYGYSRSRSGSRGRDSPYQSRGSPHYFSPFRPY